MPEKKNIKKEQSPKTASGNKLAKIRNPLTKRWVRISLAILLLVIASCGAVLIIKLAADALFFNNKHFTLRHIVVQSPGWWNGRNAKVAALLNLKLNSANLFAINLKAKRAILEAVPSIGQVAIIRVLPDSLIIDITGKIPRAVLYDRRSKWLIDNAATVMNRDNCIRISRDLPVIYGFQTSRTLTEGMILQETTQALELISLVTRFYPEIKLLTINIHDPKFMDIKLFYGSSRDVYSVKIPNEQLPYMMKILKSTLQQAQTNGEKRRVINMTYRGKAIFSGLH